MLTERSEGFPNEFFVCVWAVNFGGVEEGDTAFRGGMEKSDHLLLIFRRPDEKLMPMLAAGRVRPIGGPAKDLRKWLLRSEVVL